jgi:cell division septation protein DedD
MSDEITIDDQSHYEISLTAGQAFVAFVLLLLSLAASFAFGMMIGRGQSEDRLVVKREPSVVTEASAIAKKPSGKIVELGVTDDDFKPGAATKTDTASTAAPVITEGTTTASPAAVAPSTSTAAVPAQPAAATTRNGAAPSAVAGKAAEPSQAAAVPTERWGAVYAQLLSTADQKTAEGLAAKAINGGFNSAYVDRATSEKGVVFRVRIKFSSEAEARAAEPKLREFAKDVWIVK